MLKENEGKSMKKTSSAVMSPSKASKTPKTCPKKTAPPPPPAGGGGGKKPQSVQSKKKKQAETGKLAREIVADLEQNVLHIGGHHHHHHHKSKKGSAKSRKSKSSSKGRHHSHGQSLKGSRSHSRKSKKSKRSSKKSMEFFEVEVTHPGSVHHHHKNIAGKYPLAKLNPCSVGKPKSTTSNQSKKSRKSGSKTSLKKSAKGKKTL